MLTPRESQLVELMYGGAKPKEIACAMGIGHQTVKNMLADIYRKCKVRDQVELIILRHRWGGELRGDL